MDEFDIKELVRQVIRDELIVDLETSAVACDDLTYHYLKIELRLGKNSEPFDTAEVLLAIK